LASVIDSRKPSGLIRYWPPTLMVCLFTQMIAEEGVAGVAAGVVVSGGEMAALPAGVVVSGVLAGVVAALAGSAHATAAATTAREPVRARVRFPADRGRIAILR
jgi:hypothetical protein